MRDETIKMIQSLSRNHANLLIRMVSEINKTLSLKN